MMVLPLLFLFVMPKLLANADPETQKVGICCAAVFFIFKPICDLYGRSIS